MLRNNGGYQPKEPPGGFRLKPGYNPFSNKSTPLGLENNCEKLLGKNGELVKERQKQVLAGALKIVQRYCEETPNKMEVVAAMFGKKLGEQFKVRHCYCVGEYTAYFTKDGYMVKTTRDSWKDDSLLVSLISGKSVIVGGDVNNADRKE